MSEEGKKKPRQKKDRATDLEVQQRIELTVKLILSGYSRRDDAYNEFVKTFPNVKRKSFHKLSWNKAQKRLTKMSDDQIEYEIGEAKARYNWLIRMALAKENNDSDFPTDVPTLKQIREVKGLTDSLVKLRGLAGAIKVEVEEVGNKSIPFEYWAEVNKKAREAAALAKENDG